MKQVSILIWSLVGIGFALGSCVFPSCDEVQVEPTKERRVTLPEKCRPYYGDGTDRWINCMGVGYVQ